METINEYWIDDDGYATIQKKMPIATVDALIVHHGKLLLMKRNNPPVKGEWWVPGGRIFKNESIEDAVKRKVFEETGLQCTVIKQLGVINQIFPECHTISIFYLVECNRTDVKLNTEHSDYKWVSELPENSHQYLRHMVKTAYKEYTRIMGSKV